MSDGSKLTAFGRSREERRPNAKAATSVDASQQKPSSKTPPAVGSAEAALAIFTQSVTHAAAPVAEAPVTATPENLSPCELPAHFSNGTELGSGAKLPQGRERQRRALISAQVGLRSVDTTAAGPDEVTTTADVSRAYRRGMDLAVTLPYSKTSDEMQIEQSGRVVRLTEMPGALDDPSNGECAGECRFGILQRIKISYLAVLVLLVVVSSFPGFAQSNDVALSAVGQFTHPVTGFTYGLSSGLQSSKNSFGVGIEYRHWFGNNGLSVEYSRTASNATFVTWTMGETRYSLNGAYVRRFNVHSFITPYVSVGGGTFVTYGNQGTWSNGVHASGPAHNTWWDHQNDATIGAGADIAINKTFKLRVGYALDFFRAPNFADPTYRGGRTFIQEPKIGLVYTWGNASS
jgi:hypothetical protein